MNFAKKKVLSIAAGLASIVFTIVSVSTATVAWFNANNTVTATGMNVKCAVPSAPINLTYEVLKFDDDTKLGVNFGQDPSAIELPEYDSYISKKNEYANVILRLEATFTEGLPTTEYVAFDIDCSADLFKTVSQTTYIDDQTSNVIQYKSAVYSYTFEEESDPPSKIVTPAITDTFSQTPAVNDDARYKSATTYFDGLYTSTVYVSPAERNSSKVSNKIVTLMPDIGSRSSVISSIVIYLELAYNFGLVDNYLDTRLVSGSSGIDLTGDINDLAFYTTSSPVSLDSITLSVNSVSLMAGNSTNVTSTSSGNVTWRAAEDTGSVTLSNTSNTGATINAVSAGHAVVSATTGQASVFLDANIARAVVAAVQLNRNTMNGVAGQNGILIASPFNFSGPVTYSWSTGNANIATVSATGNPATVHFEGAGTTTITCTATDGTHTAYAQCTVSVVHPIVTLNFNTLQCNVSEIASLIATPSNFSGPVTYYWSSSNPSIASISGTTSTISLTCNAPGTAIITVTASADGTVEVATDTCIVTVVNFALDKNTLVGEKSKTGQLTATAAGNTGLTGTVTYVWSSTNSSVASFSASNNVATISFLAIGTATIKVEASNGIITLSDTCLVTVGELTLDKPEIYALNTASDGSLTATLSGVSGPVTYSFSSGTQATATVTSNANVAAIDFIAAGTTVITCTAICSGTTFTASMTVYVASAVLDKYTLSGTQNGTGTVTVTALGFIGVTLFSVGTSNSSVATAVMTGNVCTVTYVGVGTANITISVQNGNVSTSLVCAVTVVSAAIDITDTILIKGFGGYTGSSYTSAVQTDTTQKPYTLMATKFMGSTGQIRGNQSGATANFYLKNSTTRSGYYIKSITITVTGGTLATESARTLVYWGSSEFAISPSGTPTPADSIGTGKYTVTWTNTGNVTSYRYFIIWHPKTSGNAVCSGVQIVWGVG